MRHIRGVNIGHIINLSLDISDQLCSVEVSSISLHTGLQQSLNRWLQLQ